MKKILFKIRIRSLLYLTAALSIASYQQCNGAGKDAGYLFLEPQEERRAKKFKDGKTLIAFHQKGTVFSDDETSPWHKATFFAQGSVLRDKDNLIIAEVSLSETIDKDGDLTWSAFWKKEDGTSEISIKAGTGKWKGIAGSGVLAKNKVNRLDSFTQPEYSFDWELANLPPAAGRNKPEDYQFHDSGLSFHGPHIYDFSKELKNGVTLLVSSQSGVLLSDDKNALSPRNFATCYDRGTTYKPAPGSKGGSNGDAMLLEDTDPDGDIVWLYHEWWYSNPPGSYEFIGGTGKWKGITGYGVTKGMLKRRTDDHYMLKSEMHWNLPSK